MFFHDRGFWASAVAAWAVIAFLALGGWWPEAKGILPFFQRWVATTATIYALHALAHVTIAGAIEAAAARGGGVMKLQAYIQDGAGGMAALTPSASGVQVSSGYYIAADVDALLARIRAAGDGLALAAADVSRLSGLPDSMPNLGALGAARMTLNEAIAAWQTVKGAE